MSKNVEGYVRALQGINYKDWIKLKVAIDRTFEKSIDELEKTLELTDTDVALRLIQSQFG